MRELPPGWRVVPLSDVAEVRLGRQRAPKHETGVHLRPYLRAANVGWAGLKLDDVKEMNFDPREFETYRLRDGDLLLAEASGSPGEVGKPALFRGEVDGCCFQNTLIRIRAHSAVPEYLYFHMLADARLGRFAAVGKGSGINHLGAERMASWPTKLPAADEQRRIVEKLHRVRGSSRRAREALDSIPPLLEKLRQSILASAFRGDLTKDWRAKHPDVEPASELLKRIRVERRKKWEEAGLAKMVARRKAPSDGGWKLKYAEPPPVGQQGPWELPASWCWATVSELGGIQLGQRRAPEYANDVAYPYVRAANITWRGIDASDIKTMGIADPETLFLRRGDVVLSEASGSPTEVGKPALWNDEVPRCCFQATVCRASLSVVIRRPVPPALGARWIT